MQRPSPSPTNTGESMRKLILGRKAISRPPSTHKRVNRRTYEGSKVAVLGDHRGALELGHTVVPIVIHGGVRRLGAGRM